MKVRVFNAKNVPIDRRHRVDDNLDDLPYDFEIDQDKIGIHKPVKFNGLIYSPGSLRQDSHVVCDVIRLTKDIDYKFTKDIVCPYCGSEVMDSWERLDCDEIECASCISSFSYERIATVDYVSKKVKKYRMPEIKG